MAAQHHRPFGVTILAVLASVAFIINAFVTLLFLGALPITLFGRTGFFGEALFGAILWAFLTLIWGAVAVGLWTMNPFSWLFVVGFSALSIIFAVVSLLGATSLGAVLPTIVISAAILIYCLSPGIKEAFGIPTRPPNQPTA